MTPEGRVKAKVKRLLKDKYYHFMPVQNGMGAPALDYFVCPLGFFVAIETKAPGKKLTPRQRLTAEAIASSGGRVIVVRDDEDLEYLERELRCRAAFAGIYDRLQ